VLLINVQYNHYMLFPTSYIKTAVMAMALAVVIAHTACSDSTSLGTNLITDEEFPNSLVTDTFSLVVNTIPSDSVSTSPIFDVVNNFARTYLLGTLNDPELGTANASIYTQIRLPNNDLDLGDDLKLDSAVLVLTHSDINTIYGDSTSTLTVSVHEVLEDMQPFTTYYSNQRFAYNPIPIGQKQDFSFRSSYSTTDTTEINLITNPDVEVDVTVNDSVGYVITTRNSVNSLRIPLNSSFGNRLLAQSGTLNFDNRENFLQYFKGLYIQAHNTASANAIAKFNLVTSNTRLILYYQQGDIEELSIDFLINQNVAAINAFTHNYANSPIEQILAQDSPNGQETAYLQAMQGLGIQIDVPYLKNLGKVSINKAELSFTVIPTTANLYFPPNDLLLLGTDIEMPENLLAIATAPLSFEENDGLNLESYTIVLNNYAQDKLEGLADTRVEQIFVNAQSINPNRAIVGGPNHPEYPMKLKIYYTPIE